jgi:hypothetical protein
VEQLFTILLYLSLSLSLSQSLSLSLSLPSFLPSSLLFCTLLLLLQVFIMQVSSSDKIGANKSAFARGTRTYHVLIKQRTTAD